jgi:hypothetical protein
VAVVLVMVLAGWVTYEVSVALSAGRWPAVVTAVLFALGPALLARRVALDHLREPGFDDRRD